MIPPKIVIKERVHGRRTLYALYDGGVRVSRWYNSWNQANDVLKLLESGKDA